MIGANLLGAVLLAEQSFEPTYSDILQAPEFGLRRQFRDHSKTKPKVIKPKPRQAQRAARKAMRRAAL